MPRSWRLYRIGYRRDRHRKCNMRLYKSPATERASVSPGFLLSRIPEGETERERRREKEKLGRYVSCCDTFRSQTLQRFNNQVRVCGEMWLTLFTTEWTIGTFVVPKTNFFLFASRDEVVQISGSDTPRVTERMGAI